MARIGYIRVSTAFQNTDRQEDAMALLGVEKVFIEKASGKNTNRPELKKLLDYVRDGDVLVVSEISRLARSTRDLLNILDILQQKQVSFVSLKESIDTTTPQGRFVLTIFGALSELEREGILTRQREGIEAAKSRGKHLGRPAMPYPPNWEQVYQAWKSSQMTPSEAARKLAIKRPTLYLMARRWESQNPLAV